MIPCATCRVPQGVSACTLIPTCHAWNRSKTLMFYLSETPKSDILNPSQIPTRASMRLCLLCVCVCVCVCVCACIHLDEEREVRLRHLPVAQRLEAASRRAQERRQERHRPAGVRRQRAQLHVHVRGAQRPQQRQRVRVCAARDQSINQSTGFSHR